MRWLERDFGTHCPEWTPRSGRVGARFAAGELRLHAVERRGERPVERRGKRTACTVGQSHLLLSRTPRASP